MFHSQIQSNFNLKFNIAHAKLQRCLINRFSQLALAINKGNHMEKERQLMIGKGRFYRVTACNATHVIAISQMSVRLSV